MRRVTVSFAVAACSVLCSIAPAGAEDSFPQNGKIAFSSSGSDIGGRGDIYTVEPDGSDLSQLTDSRYDEGFATWSPDGTVIIFWRQYLGDVNLSVMSADGSNARDLDTNWTGGIDFTWTPDGTKLAFSRSGPPHYTYDIYTMDPDGSNKINLTKTPKLSEQFPDFSPNGSRMCFTVSGGLTLKTQPGIYVTDTDRSDPTLLFEDDTGQGECDWSPDGQKVAFYTIEGGDTQKAMQKQKKAMEKAAAEEDFQKKMEKASKASAHSDKEVYVINADGSGLTALTRNSADDVSPHWSPDGTKIAFTSNRNGDSRYSNIYTMDADGSDVDKVTNWPYGEGASDWQPLPRPMPHKDAGGSDVAQGTKKPAADDVDRERPERTVIVKPGDSLWSISEERLGPEASPQRVYEHTYKMYALNRKIIGSDPDLIFVGQRLSLPPLR
jgi:Tol biopolymer transport system component